MIDDREAEARAADVRRLIFCSGKVAVDLLTSPHRASPTSVAICRVEQLYPIPVNEMFAAIERYPSLEEVVWVQEEPENMGAWDFVRPSLEELVGRRRLAVVARPRSSSPSEGSAARHAQIQERLVAQRVPAADDETETGGDVRKTRQVEVEAPKSEGACVSDPDCLSSCSEGTDMNIVVPEMGESIVDARVTRWLKNEGDAVAAGEALVELETDKVDVEVSAPQAGVLETIAHAAGADVKIGEVLGRDRRR